MFKVKSWLGKNFSVKYQNSLLIKFTFCLLLSWLYAICSQIIIPLPFNFVPISLQPLPIFLLSLIIGWPAVYAYFLYYLQGALGLPFFSGFSGGLIKILGPTGGYLIGFGIAALFLVVVKNNLKNSCIITFAKLLIANVILHAFGLLQLSFFIPFSKLFIFGLFPFILGAMFKMLMIIIFLRIYNKK